MCAIGSSVGFKGMNHSQDVKTVRILLNLNLPRMIRMVPVDLGFPGGGRVSFQPVPVRLGPEDLGCAGGGRVQMRQQPLPVTGSIDDDTIATIRQFQEIVLKNPKPDGRVDAGGQTVKALMTPVPMAFNQDLLALILIGARNDDIARYFPALNAGMAANQVNTPLRIAHFLAQLAHESGSFLYSEEIASGEAYEGRADLGNNQAGDGKRFKGRGLIQITGRSNYKAYGDDRGQDYVSAGRNTLLATDPNAAVDCSLWFWTRNDLNALADKDDVNAITKEINGGYNGLEDRKAKLARAKCFLIR